MSLVLFTTLFSCLTLAEERAAMGLPAAATENAVVIWDPQKKRQRFIREAVFTNAGSRMGFLVPTPTVPDVRESSPNVFKSLDDAIKPEVQIERRQGIHFQSVGEPTEEGVKSAEPMTGTETEGYEIARTTTTANYRIDSIRAEDIRGIRTWARRQRFQFDRRAEAWLEKYVRAGWVINAFALRNPNADRVKLPPVELDFETSRPFFPYREPANPAEPDSRLFRLFVLGPQTIRAGLEDRTEWTAEVRYRAPLPAQFQQSVAVPAGTQVTAFDDFTTRRPDSELWFTDSDQPNYVPEPIREFRDERIIIPSMVWVPTLAGILLVGAFAATRRRR